jgi:hypothetical protein
MVGYHLIISNKSKLWITFVISLFFLMKNNVKDYPGKNSAYSGPIISNGL